MQQGTFRSGRRFSSCKAWDWDVGAPLISLVKAFPRHPGHVGSLRFPALGTQPSIEVCAAREGLPGLRPRAGKALRDNGLRGHHSWRSARAATAPPRPDTCPGDRAPRAAASPSEQGRGRSACQLRRRVLPKVGGAADRTESASRPGARPASERELRPHLEMLLEADGEDLSHGGRGDEEAAAAAVVCLVGADSLTGGGGGNGSGSSRGGGGAGALPWDSPHVTAPRGQ